MKFGYKKLYINGTLSDASSGEIFNVVCPGTEETIATVAWASKEDTTKTLQSAQEGFKLWSSYDKKERAEWMLKLRDALLKNEDLLRTSIMYEMGKAWENTEEDFVSITNSLRYYAEVILDRDNYSIPDKEGSHEHEILEQPVGVAVAFLAYNFPLLNLGFKLGPALASGCSIILKPSEYSPLSAYIIGEICHEINFPKGVVNVLCGDTQNVGIPLCESTIPKLITLIGSTKTAQNLIIQSTGTSIKRFSMECGGNAPFIVGSDADLNKAVEIAAALKTSNTGQICVAPNRFYVHENRLEEFVSGLKTKFSETPLGFGQKEQPQMGPLANKASVLRMEELTKEALEQGGKLIFGGKTAERKGYFFEPTIIVFNDQTPEVLDKEIFGPIAFIVPFSNIDDVIVWSNDTDAGLASYIFSNNKEEITKVVEHLEFGEVQVNGVKYDIYLPHGGIKNSGMGVDCSERALDDYLIKKRVSTALA